MKKKKKEKTELNVKNTVGKNGINMYICLSMCI